ncbi:hypothetical protein [Lacunisphaera limnophila]|uniref:hypothetical protein n=1 Tax=Lacunisphaera limnophila TaxID=1838286 RepID=UPI000859A033|nr:hypothetical protein [Lacunisphaera limnophila]
MVFLLLAYRSVAQPLTGPDTIFRWDFLARQIVQAAGMGFYPAIQAEDFARYMWPESIPPLVALLYAWSYLGAGSFDASLTAPVVLLVAGLGYGLVGMLAARLGGRAAAYWALVVLAGSAMHTWSVSMGQETGLTTLGLLAMAWALGGDQTETDWRLAALAAGTVALSRDYGLMLVPFGLAWLVWRRRPGREVIGFVLATLLMLLPWYARVWMRTGNPLYNFDLGGWFPINEMHAGLMHSFRARYGFSGHGAERLAEASQLAWPLGAGLLLSALLSMRRGANWPVFARWLAAGWLALWLGSVSYTAGGLGYSLRVLSPVLALLAVAGGAGLSRVPGRWRGWLLAGLLVLTGEATVRALVMMQSPLGIPAAAWLKVGAARSAQRGDHTHDRAAAIIGSGRVVVDDAYLHAFLVARGVKVLPLWSPEMSALIPQGLAEAAVGRRLRAAGVTHCCLTLARDQREYYDRLPLMHALGPWMRPVQTADFWLLLEIVPPVER